MYCGWVMGRFVVFERTVLVEPCCGIISKCMTCINIAGTRSRWIFLGPRLGPCSRCGRQAAGAAAIQLQRHGPKLPRPAGQGRRASKKNRPGASSYTSRSPSSALLPFFAFFTLLAAFCLHVGALVSLCVSVFLGFLCFVSVHVCVCV